MAGNLGNDYTEQVRAASDIVQVISQSVELKKRGKDFLGLCPFHQEKTPSFHVSPSKQMFYCYGCKAGGDVFKFVMLRDRLEFLDARRELGRAAGIAEPENPGNRSAAGERQKLIEAHSVAATFFENYLTSPAGQAARDYLKKRGFTGDSVRQFRIGLAPDAWDGLLRGPVGKKFPAPLLLQAGLVKARDNGGFYDTFRNRIMFPIRNETGQIIAFGGRVTPGSQDPAKYLNSPETPLFSKSRAIYGFDLARKKMAESRTAAVVEGYTDVVMAHQFGASNVVSVLGTAMTAPHVQLLRRFTDKIVLLFDADTAGDTAADRVVELFLTQPIEIAIAALPDGLDPDEYLLQHGVEAFDQLLATATDVLSYKWKQLVHQFKAEAGDLTGQQKVLERYLDLLASARGAGPVDSLRWGAALARVSRLSDIPIDELNRRFRTRKGQADSSSRGPVAARNDESGAGAAPVKMVKRVLNGRDRAERWILGALLLEPNRWQQVQMQVHVEDFLDPDHRHLAEIYWNHQVDAGEPVLAEFLGTLPEPHLVELAVMAVDELEAMVNPPARPTQPGRKAVVQSAPSLEQTLAEAMEFLRMQTQLKEQQKLVSQLRRTNHGSEQPPIEDTPSESVEPSVNPAAVIEQVADEVALLAEIVKKSQGPNLHRTGPVRRTR